MLLCQGEFFNIFDLGYIGPQGAVLKMNAIPLVNNHY